LIRDGYNAGLINFSVKILFCARFLLTLQAITGKGWGSCASASGCLVTACGHLATASGGLATAERKTRNLEGLATAERGNIRMGAWQPQSEAGNLCHRLERKPLV